MDVNKLLDQAIRLGYEGEVAERFVAKQIRDYEEREDRAIAREKEREREQAEREKEQAKLEKEKIRLESEEAEKARKHELEVLKLKSDPNYNSSPADNLPKSSLPKIPPFDDQVDEIDLYIDRFEKLAKFHKWEKDQYSFLLGTLLRGKALKIYCNLSPQVADDYDELKKALLKAFKVNSNVYRKRFREVTILPDECFVQLCCRLGQYFDKWVELSKIPKSYEKIRDFMIYDQLLTSCSHDLRTFLLEQEITDSFKLAECADRYLTAHGMKKCRKVKQNAKPFSNATGKSTEIKSDSDFDVTCHHCREKGHIRPNCPVLKLNKKKVQDKAVPKIGVVLDREEKLTDCVSDPNGKVFDQTVEVVFDTGCNTVVICNSLVPEDCELGRKIKVYDYLGRPLHLKTVNCHVDSKFFSGNVRAVVAPIKCTQVIVGRIPGLKDNVEQGLNLISNGFDKDDIAVGVVTRGQARNNTSRDSSQFNTVDLSDDLKFNYDEFVTQQNECKTLSKIRNNVQSGEILTLRNRKIKFVKVNELIYRKCVDSKDIVDVDRMQLVVPLKYRAAIMKLAHESLMSGHFASRKTTDKIFQRFYWPRASLDIHNFCKSCHACQKFSVKPKKVPMVNMPVVKEPFSRIAIDLIGPITPSSKRGHRYILTIIDMATRYPEAIPLRNIDTVSVAEALVEVFCHVGVPREILSDRGTQFKSDLMQEINRLLSIKALYSSPYHAACNGMVERMNGTLKNMLKRICIDQPNEWDKYINVALFAYREIPNDTLKFSPFELLYGRNVRGPLCILHELVSNNSIDPELKPSYQYVLDLRNKLEETAKVAVENAKVSAQKYKEYFDRKSSFRKFKVNDEVLVMLPTSTNKFTMQWKGPYLISNVHSNGVDYYVKVGNQTKLYHANMLKAYHRRVSIAQKEIHELNHSSQLLDLINNTDVLEEPTSNDNFKEPDFDLYLIESKGKSETNVNKSLAVDQVTDIENLLDKFQDVLNDKPGRTNLISHKINLHNHEPVKSKNYPIPVNLANEFDLEVDKMLDMDIIQPSTSNYCSPVVLIRKPDSSLRLCVDFRKLNKNTIFDAEPMPSISDDLHKFRDANYFTELDLSKGYWQVNLDPESRKYTAFSTKYGLMEFKVMPFGLNTACATFVRLMRRVLANLSNVSCYFDNIVIYSKTWADHMKHIESVFSRLREYGLTAGPKKCYFGFHEIKYLGYQLGNNSLQPIKSRIDNITEMPLPTTKKSLRSFMGTIGYYNRFIPNFSDIAAPINELLKKKSSNILAWSNLQLECFNELKSNLVKSPILALPDVNKTFYLRTDASDNGLGAAVLQEHDGIFKPVCFAGKKLNSAEKRYSTIEKECYGIVWGINRFKEFLYGKEFVLQTDHMPLKFLCGMKNKNDRLFRWILSLQPYNFVIEYIKGAENICSDMISRCI